MSRGPFKDDVKSQEYYRFAYQCLELVHTKGGCNNNCGACPLNVHLYIDDPREAILIKTSAAIDFKKQQHADAIWKAHKSGENWGMLIYTILLLAVLWFTVIWPVSCAVKGVKQLFSAAPFDTLEAPSNPQYEGQQFYSDTATPEIQQRIFKASELSWNVKKDKDYNGQIDCIDSALTFYELYGSEAKIIWLYNPPDSHLFCAVPNGYGGLVYLETTRSGPLSFMLMQNAWGKRFTSAQLRDMTYAYKDIKTGGYVWRW